MSGTSIIAQIFVPLKRQEKNASENIVCRSCLLQLIA